MIQYITFKLSLNISFSMAQEFKRIVAPVDGSPEAKKAAKKAIFLAKQIGVDVVALYVVDKTFLARFPAPEDLMSFNWDKFLQKEAFDVLDDIEKMGEKENVRVIKELKEGIPDDVIIKAAGKKDLIVMGSKGKTALDRIFLGSVSEKVLHHSPSSVLIIK